MKDSTHLNLSTYRKILAITFTLALLGLIAECVQMFVPVDFYEEDSFILKFTRFFHSLFFENNGFPIRPEGGSGVLGLLESLAESFYRVSYTNIGFYFLLLLGGILFIFSKKKEFRLIRFVLSIIFMWSLFNLMSNIILTPFYIDKISVPLGWLWWTLFPLKQVVIVIISTWVIKQLKALTKLNASYETINSSYYFLPSETSKWKRAIHLIVDGILIYFITIPFIRGIFSTVLWGIGKQELMQTLTIDYAIRLLGYLIFYLFFETIFSATPGKFLTNTRVVSTTGDKPNFATILKRTLLRLVPFDGILFLFDNGFHDRHSGTFVVNEKLLSESEGLANEEPN